MRNAPYDTRIPAFTTFPLTAAHVSTIVTFARTHRLCVMVLSTGHDVMNRHSCDALDSAIAIRTIFLKSLEFVNDTQRVPGGGLAVVMGAGVVTDEAQAFASTNGAYVSSAWMSTVGMVGWSLGGGHGPHAPSRGLGADNILEAQVVLADGSIVIANAVNQQRDLWWALRGGGGSTWGVVTSLTVRAFRTPPGGFALAQASWSGNACLAGSARLNNTVQALTAWMVGLGAKWGGFVAVTPRASAASSTCGMTWTVEAQYVYQGAFTEAQYTSDLAPVASIPGISFTSTSFATAFTLSHAAPREPLNPTDFLYPRGGFVGGQPSVVVPREAVAAGLLAAHVTARAAECASSSLSSSSSATTPATCPKMQMFHDLTGQVNATQDANVSLSAGTRRGLVHYALVSPVAVPRGVLASLFALGASSSFSESAFSELDSSFASSVGGGAWSERYWGAANYQALLRIKRAVDPSGLFWCRRCVGDDSARSADVFPASPSSSSSLFPPCSVAAWASSLLLISVSFFS